jgi:hypothetical protein
MSHESVLDSAMPVDHPAHEGWFLKGLQDPPQANIDAIYCNLQQHGVEVGSAKLAEVLHRHTMGVTARRDEAEKSTLAHLGNTANVNIYNDIAGKKEKQGEVVAFFAQAVYDSRSSGQREIRRPGLDLGGVRGQYGNWGALGGSDGLMETIGTLPGHLHASLQKHNMSVRALRTHRQGHGRTYRLLAGPEELAEAGRGTRLLHIMRRVALLDAVIQLPKPGAETAVEVFLDSRFVVAVEALPPKLKGKFDEIIRTPLADRIAWDSALGSNSQIANSLGRPLESELEDYRQSHILGKAFIPLSTHTVIAAAKKRQR